MSLSYRINKLFSKKKGIVVEQKFEKIQRPVVAEMEKILGKPFNVLDDGFCDRIGCFLMKWFFEIQIYIGNHGRTR